MASKSTNYYKSHASALKIKQEYQAKRNKTTKEKKNIAEHTRVSRAKGTYGNGDNKDWSRKKGGGFISEAPSKNRARNRGKA